MDKQSTTNLDVLNRDASKKCFEGPTAGVSGKPRLAKQIRLGTMGAVRHRRTLTVSNQVRSHEHIDASQDAYSLTFKTDKPAQVFHGELVRCGLLESSVQFPQSLDQRRALLRHVEERVEGALVSICRQMKRNGVGAIDLRNELGEWCNPTASKFLAAALEVDERAAEKTVSAVFDDVSGCQPLIPYYLDYWWGKLQFSRKGVRLHVGERVNMGSLGNTAQNGTPKRALRYAVRF